MKTLMIIAGVLLLSTSAHAWSTEFLNAVGSAQSGPPPTDEQIAAESFMRCFNSALSLGPERAKQICAPYLKMKLK